MNRRKFFPILSSTIFGTGCTLTEIKKDNTAKPVLSYGQKVCVSPLPKPSNFGEIFTRNEVYHFIRDKSIEYESEQIPSIILNDSYYIVVDHRWMLEMIEWWEDFKNQFSLQWTEEKFDCDDFAKTLITFANFALMKNNRSKAQPAIGTIAVKQKHSWAEVPAGGGHALNCFVSNEGVFILEPQNSRHISLDNYPNKSSVFRVSI